jgi:hypothetical protein
MDQWSQIRVAPTSRLVVLAIAALATSNGCATDEPTGNAPPVLVGPTAGAGVIGNPPAGTAGVGAGPVGAPVAGGAMPCEVEMAVKTGCQTCHGATPIGGAPMKLMALGDFQADYTVVSTPQLKGQKMKMYELARIRLNREQGTTPMPQGAPLSATHFSALDGWLRGGAPAGNACSGGITKPGDVMNPGNMNAGSGAGGMGGGSVAQGGAGGTGLPMGENSQCDVAGAFEPLVARDGETCYEFKTHGQSGATDTTEFAIPLDESYSQFYFNVPWPAGSVATRFGSRFDNLKVLHHWLAFSSISGNPAGTVAKNVTGTTLGENAELIAGWAVGGCTTEYPNDVGVVLPDSGKIMVQWHHYNNTGMPQTDGSAVQICTVPKAMRQNLAGLTFLGTEDIFLGPGKPTAVGTCENTSGKDIHILGFTPHMHTIGIHMKSEVMNPDGKMDVPFDKPFVFDQQVNYMQNPPYILKPGARITSTCTYQNDSGVPVAFGQSTSQEMCYQFTVAYPYEALNRGNFSLIGATNTCWGD